jgi:hypothetical protein
MQLGQDDFSSWAPVATDWGQVFSDIGGTGLELYKTYTTFELQQAQLEAQRAAALAAATRPTYFPTVTGTTAGVSNQNLLLLGGAAVLGIGLVIALTGKKR